jgi:hypothetical protein
MRQARTNTAGVNSHSTPTAFGSAKEADALAGRPPQQAARTAPILNNKHAALPSSCPRHWKLKALKAMGGPFSPATTATVNPFAGSLQIVC